jgi:acetyltransferase-like isoleucine patch superfamily enzyme
MNLFLRILFLPLGLFKGMFELSIDGSRDILNKFRFNNVKIDKGCSVDKDSIIDKFVHILENTTINNSKIKSYSYVGCNCLIQNTTIGKFCSIANDVKMGLGNHPLDSFSTSTIFYQKNNTLNININSHIKNITEYKSITIGNDVWIGASVIILDGICIGNGAVIGANAVVTKDIPPYAIVGGTPAKIIKYRFSDSEIKNLVSSGWWDLSLSEIVEKFISKS